MNDPELIARLALLREGKTIVETADVTDRVMARIGRARGAEAARIWMVTAAAGCVIAAVAWIGAAQAWSSMLNPLSDLNSGQVTGAMP
jgi:hypothetical protein